MNIITRNQADEALRRAQEADRRNAQNGGGQR